MSTMEVTIQANPIPILIVEDDEPTQNLLQALLRRFGYSSEIAVNGGEAIALLRQRDYAVVVLHMMMPEVNGREVIEFIVTAAKPTPVIIRSAAGPSTYANADQAVVKAVIRKPFDIDEIIAAISGVTGSQKTDSRLYL